MYQPVHHEEKRLEVMQGLIRAHPLGLLVSNGADGPLANLVPFLLDGERSAYGTLRAHVARANPQWRAIAERAGEKVLVIFQGVNAYITPSWYATKRETGKVVPTWNYAIVQARGRARIIEDAAWLEAHVRALTDWREGARENPWSVSDAPPDFISMQLRAIVGIEIEIEEIAGKWKVSQNRPSADRAGVVEGLRAMKDDADAAVMAELVRQYGGLE